MIAPKTEAQAGGTAQGFGETFPVDAPNCANTEEERKAFATLQAAFALKGFALVKLADHTLIAERWGYVRALDDMNQAAQFLVQIGGANG